MSEAISGTFEPAERGGGHLRTPDQNYRPRPDDPVVPEALRRQLRLRGGEMLVGRLSAAPRRAAPPSARDGRGRNARSRGESARRSGGPGGSSGPLLAEVESINGLSVEDSLAILPFEKRTAIDPRRPVRFETPGGSISMRVIDLLTPIGFGQRGLIVAPPRTGKTVLLQQLAHGLAVNHPDAYMMVLLIDERPEEVTDWRRNVHGEVIASSNDENIASHVRIARLVIEKARRHVEGGQDVIVLLDSLTRLGRAFNAAIRGQGRTMSGGLDAGALTEPKSMFGAARNLEEGGSLTIMATALIETGSRMDEVIFNEFKGTGNMEIVLSRELANRRIWPAIDLPASGTRKEELLLTPAMLAASRQIRRVMLSRDPVGAMTSLLDALSRHADNAAFLAQLASGPASR